MCNETNTIDLGWLPSDKLKEVKDLLVAAADDVLNDDDATDDVKDSVQASLDAVNLEIATRDALEESAEVAQEPVG